MNRKYIAQAFKSFIFGATLIASALSFSACNNGGTSSGANTQSVIDFTGIQQVSAPTSASSDCGIVVSNFTPTVSAWWDSATFVLTNTCSTAQSVSGLQLTLSANQALNASAFSLNSVSYPVWQTTTASAVGVNGNADALLITLNTTATIPANGTASGSFGYNPNGTTLSGLNLVANGSTPVGSSTLNVEIDSSALSGVCNSSYACSIPVQLLGQGGTLYKTIATVTNNNLGDSTVSLINLLPGSYTVAPSALPQGVSESAAPSSSVTLSANTTTNVKLTFAAQTANIGNLSFTLINPDSANFTQSGLAVTLTPSVGGSALVSQAGFGALTAINGLGAGNYTLSAYGLASASKGEYYSYPATKVQINGSNATTALGSIGAQANANTISDTIAVTGLANGDSVQLSFADSMNGNSFIFNPETLTSTGASQTIGKYKFVVGDMVTVNVIVNGNYQKVAPFTFTQGSSAQNFTIGLAKAAVTTAGTLYFHAYAPQTSISAFSNGDSMTLSGDNYTDLIMSNYIAGVMLGHTIVEKFPNMQFNKDYMYGSILGQLLQENLQTQLYQSSGSLIAPSPNQAAVMGSGQGGPYQINSYAYDMVGFSTGGYSLANYVAIQKNIGFTLANQAAQAAKVTPASFNDKYYSPMLTAYFHLNDLVALNVLENGSAGYIGSAAPSYPKCMANLTTMPNSPLEIIMNYAYNQGFYGGLVGQMASDCVNMQTSAFLAKYNSYANASGSSYNRPLLKLKL